MKANIKVPQMLFETTLTREIVDRYRSNGWWPDTLLWDSVTAAADRKPSKTALIDVRGRTTYQDLLQRAEQCSLALLDPGIRHGDTVLVQLPNWNEFVVATVAIERIGAAINPVAPIFRSHELRAMWRPNIIRGGATGEMAAGVMMAQCLCRPRTMSLWCTSCASSCAASAR